MVDTPNIPWFVVEGVPSLLNTLEVVVVEVLPNTFEEVVEDPNNEDP